jgi:hypothetical protein
MARKGRKGGGRGAQLIAAYRLTKQADPRIGWILLSIGLLVFAVVFTIGYLIGMPWFGAIFAVLLAVLVMLIVFGRRAERAAFSQVEGTPGAAAAVLNSLRRGWTVTPAVAVTKNQDVVHRAIGRPGVVLVGEGAPSRVANLLAAEKRRMSRFVGDAPIYDVIVGDGANQVKLRKLHRHVTRLPRNLKPAQVTELNHRLRALGATNLPMPKGPLPKNVKLPRGPKTTR